MTQDSNTRTLVHWLLQIRKLIYIYQCSVTKHNQNSYNAFNVYCRELASGTVSLTGDRVQGDDSKH